MAKNEASIFYTHHTILFGTFTLHILPELSTFGMFKSAKLNHWPQPCYIRSLHTFLIRKICDFVVMPRAQHKDTKDNGCKRDLIGLMCISKECRLYYRETIEEFKLRYYLAIYAESYLDVLVLANQLEMKIDAISYYNGYLEYAQTKTSDDRYPNYDCGRFGQDAPLVICNGESFVNRLQTRCVKFKRNRLIEGGMLLDNVDCEANKSYDYDDYDEIRWWSKIWITHCPFHFLHMGNIRIVPGDTQWIIYTKLTTKLFKEYINKKENSCTKKVFNFLS